MQGTLRRATRRVASCATATEFLRGVSVLVEASFSEVQPLHALM